MTSSNSANNCQTTNLRSAISVADLVKSTIGPQSMKKMVLDPMGGIVLTNDGNAILRELDISHPAAKQIVELSRAQDEECGDGTTTVVVYAGEILSRILEAMDESGAVVHPRKRIDGLTNALHAAEQILNGLAITLNPANRDEMIKAVSSCLGTKSMGHDAETIANIALSAVSYVTLVDKTGRKEIDIKRYARVEKIPGGKVSDSYVVNGIMLNKDIGHAKMRRRIENPRVVLLDCPLEYKKGENAIMFTLKDPTDFSKLIELEEDHIRQQIEELKKFKPDVVFTEKGLTDLAAHYMLKANIAGFRRVKKTDNNRLARATGATIVHRTDELQEHDVGKLCGLMEVRKIGDEYFVFLENCKDPKACTILLRGPSRDVLNEVERNLHDAMNVARNLENDPRVVLGGGCVEMALSRGLKKAALSQTGVNQWAYNCVADALEVIPRQLLSNCGANTLRSLTELQVCGNEMGVNGNTGEICNIRELGIYDPINVKAQALKSAVEAACLLLRVDDLVPAKNPEK